VTAKKNNEAFAVWLTGLPAAGKSTIAAALVSLLKSRGIQPAVLESDAMRGILTPNPTFTEAERDGFYRGLVSIGALLAHQGIPIIFDATAHRKMYRDWARAEISNFIEIYVDCTLRTCMERDPKGIYRAGRSGKCDTVPGLHIPYEPPDQPDLVIISDREEAQDPKFPERAAQRIVELILARHRLTERTSYVESPAQEEGT
jgi:adenylylsulfate kinase